MCTLLLLTTGYPLSATTERSFISPEIEILAKAYDKVIILPELIIENQRLKNISLPKNVFVDDNYAKINKWPGKAALLRRLVNPLGFWSIIKDLGRLTSFSRFKLHLVFFDEAYRFNRYLKKNYSRFTNNELTIYSFWMHSAALGVAMLKSNNFKFICRTHRFDLYDEEVPYRSIYLKRYLLNKVDKVYPCSIDGEKYLKHRYPQYASKINCSYLGVVKLFSTYTANDNNTDRITFLSCSRVEPVKRVEMIYEFIRRAAIVFPKLEFRWVHIGDGSLIGELNKMIQESNVQNLDIQLLGSMDNVKVQDYYTKNHIDFFINLSSSEGLPVSIMEAMAYGVPVIATNVGGTSEIVDSSVGALINENPKAEDFIGALRPFLEGEINVDLIRANAEQRYKEKFDAKVLRMQFVDDILKLNI